MPEKPAENGLSPTPPDKRLTIIPAATPPRILLFFPAILLQLIASGLSGVGYTLNSPVFWLAGTAVWIIWFFFAFLIVIPGTDALLQRFRSWMKRAALIIIIGIITVGIAEGIILGLFTSGKLPSVQDSFVTRLTEQMKTGFQYNDGTALSHQAVQNLLEGKNPYANANIVTAMVQFHGTYDRITPLRVGEFTGVFPYPTPEELQQFWEKALLNPSNPPKELESRVCYPAGTFLLAAPFIALGLNDVRYAYDILVIGGLVYAAWRIPNKKRLLFLGAVIISLELWNTLAIGETGIIIFPLLLIAWITLDENMWVSAIFMGLAVASKQTAWFFLPFYIILLYRTTGPRIVAGTIGIIAAVFIATNGWFIYDNPSLWVQSVMSPMVEPMFPLGVGFITLTTSGLVNLQSSLPYTIAELAVFISGGIWYYFNCRKYPEAGPILAILPLFFAWRSLWTYFFYVMIIILARMLIRGDDKLLEPAVVRGGK
jgi:hypothetical protein